MLASAHEQFASAWVERIQVGYGLNSCCFGVALFGFMGFPSAGTAFFTLCLYGLSSIALETPHILTLDSEYGL